MQVKPCSIIFMIETIQNITQLADNLYVGNDLSVYEIDESFKIIHAAKTSHQRALGYTKSLPQTDPNYLVYETENELFLNMIDPSTPLLPHYTDPMFCRSFDFLRRHEGKNVLIHCNFGVSRSPSLCMAWMFRSKALNQALTFEEIVVAFKVLCPDYQPGKGIEGYLRENWKRIIEF